MLRKQLYTRLKSNDYNFLANLLLFVDVKEVDKDCVAFVKVDGSLVIHTGRQFKEFTREEQLAVILHELLHLPQMKIMDELRTYYKNAESFNKNQLNRIENIGLDACVNRDIEDMIVFTLPESAITPKNINEVCDKENPPPPPSDRLEELGYIQYVINNLKNNSKDGDGEGEAGEGEGDGEEGEGEGSQSEALKEAVKEAVKSAIKKLEQEIKDGKVTPSESDKKYGTIEGSDLINIFKQKKTLPKDIVQELESVKRKLKPIRGTKTTYAYTWGRRHKAFPSKTLPAMLKQEFIKRTEKVVLVMDSSGSCWDEKNFEKGCLIADWFKERGLLAGFWCCDTHLVKVEEERTFSKIRGGGGTKFTKAHIEEIVEDVGEDVSVLYITDGELDLSDANERKDTHVLVCF